MGEAKLIAAAARARAASRPRSTARRARRAAGAARVRRRRGARARARRSARARAGARCRPRCARPSRDRRARGARRPGPRPRAGRATSTASTEWRARSAPSGRVQPVLLAEVGDHDDEAGLARDAARRGRARRRARAGSCDAVGRDAVGQRAAQRDDPGLASRAAAAGAGARRRRSSSPRARRGARPGGRARAPRPRRRRPSAARSCRTPSTARRRATIHVVSVRSGTCRRTCGSPVRAVAAASIWRTSSPTSYGRSCASSVPAPMPAARRSPGSAPGRAARDDEVERVDQRRAACGPGPWRAAAAAATASLMQPPTRRWRALEVVGLGLADRRQHAVEERRRRVTPSLSAS